MTSPTQSDLFDILEPAASDVAVDGTFARTTRTALDAHSWIEVVPGWMTGADRLFEHLIEAVPWQQHDRRVYDQTFQEPRLTAEYRNLHEVAHPALVDAADALSRHYGVRYDSLWLNLYRDGRDSTGWHRDRFSCRRPDCVVPVLTLGATRRFLIKPRRGGTAIKVSPRSGDLVVMGGRAQEDWVHGVPKEPGIFHARISINFQSASQARR
jgi:alkylated DNA repair dioxygenase AlkB